MLRHALGWGGGVVMLTFLALAHMVQQMAGSEVNPKNFQWVQCLRMALGTRWYRSHGTDEATGPQNELLFGCHL